MIIKNIIIIHSCQCMYVCLNVCLYVCMYVYMYVCVYVCVSVFLSVCMYVCMYVCSIYETNHSQLNTFYAFVHYCFSIYFNVILSPMFVVPNVRLRPTFSKHKIYEFFVVSYNSDHLVHSHLVTKCFETIMQTVELHNT
jgi:hypothetical protein